ncbi:MAG: hypothetical protein OXL39_10335 [Caldilineaceae bacterium]|nr:hypothetical protein [Caldilineaceae bacterium]
MNKSKEEVVKIEVIDMDELARMGPESTTTIVLKIETNLLKVHDNIKEALSLIRGVSRQ